MPAGLKAGETLFVKTVKGRQDFRFDVPCFGMKTLETMRDSGTWRPRRSSRAE